MSKLFTDKQDDIRSVTNIGTYDVVFRIVSVPRRKYRISDIVPCTQIIHCLFLYVSCYRYTTLLLCLSIPLTTPFVKPPNLTIKSFHYPLVPVSSPFINSFLVKDLSPYFMVYVSGVWTL